MSSIQTRVFYIASGNLLEFFFMLAIFTNLLKLLDSSVTRWDDKRSVLLLKGAIMDIIKTIEEKIHNSIDVIDINIIDESAKHADHYFASSSTLPSHIKLILISDSFIGMNTLKRHKLIYELLKSEIELIHAISLHLYTQNEYNLKNK